jgi:uncharacterized protein (DUF983 family)
MPFTKCPNCRKVQQVSSKLMSKKIGCMGERCGTTFRAEEYRLHSGAASMIVFMAVIAFALFMLCRWLWTHSVWIINNLG